jgi:hypothetical protein
LYGGRWLQGSLILEVALYGGRWLQGSLTLEVALYGGRWLHGSLSRGVTNQSFNQASTQLWSGQPRSRRAQDIKCPHACFRSHRPGHDTRLLFFRSPILHSADSNVNIADEPAAESAAYVNSPQHAAKLWQFLWNVAFRTTRTIPHDAARATAVVADFTLRTSYLVA